MLRRTLLQLPALLASRWTGRAPADFLQEITAMMRVGPVPAAGIGLIEKGKPGWRTVIGVMNAKTNRPATESTIFEAASLSKQPTAYGIMLLADRGKLDLDEPLSARLDFLADPQAKRITPRHVLSHSSGLPNWRQGVGALKPSFAPGEQFQYSGEGYVLLQRLIEHITGDPFPSWMRANVFEPLGMTSTAMFANPDWKDRITDVHSRRGEPNENRPARTKRWWDLAAKWNKPLLTWNYADMEKAAGELGNPPLPDNFPINAAASMMTTIPDYALFLAKAMTHPIMRKLQTKIRETLSWGLGWGLEQAGGHTYVWQWGDNPGSKNFVAADPETGFGVFVFTNGDAGAHVYDRIVRAATGHDHPALFFV
jgi:CubicO group peptidase (beta-lactamase class C family)